MARALALSLFLVASPALATNFGSWRAETSPAQGRWNPAIVPLADGRVLVAGGAANGYDEYATEVDTVEVYDPQTGAWEDLPSLPAPAHGQWSALLPSGEVLIAGGWSASAGGDSSKPQSQSWVLDPAHPDEGWRETGPMPYGMWAPYGLNHATVLDDGRVLVRGGLESGSLYSGGVSTRSALYDPESETWDVTRDLIARPPAVVDGVGGALARLSADEVGGDEASEVLFRFEDGEAAFADNLAGQYLTLDAARYFVLIVEGPTSLIVYAAGAEDVERGADEPYAVGGLPPQTQLVHRTVSGLEVKLADGRVFVAGGHDQRGLDSPYVQIFDPSTGRWNATTPMPIVRREDLDANGEPLLADHAGARWSPVGGLLPDGSILVAGGSASNSDTGAGFVRTSAVRYVPATEKWSILSTRLSTPRSGAGTARLPGNAGLLIVGGWEDVASAEIFDFRKRRFVAAPSTGAADDIFGGGLVTLPGGDLLLLGGVNWDDGAGSREAMRFVIHRH